mgnify:CR=1 FL=1
MMTPDERYRHDPEFTVLVDAIYQQLVRCRFTPTELRDAAMLAAMKYDYSHIRKTWPCSEVTANVGEAYCPMCEAWRETGSVVCGVHHPERG